MTDKENIKWQDWETVGLIGRGSFGDVYEIKRKVFDETEKAALKIISIPQNSKDIEEMYNDGYDEESITGTFESHLKSILAEYTLMRKMSDCVNIVRCDDVHYEHHEDGIGWNIYIRMELLTPLTKALPVVVPEETVIELAKDICTALDCCKKYNVIHRDIKPQNIFVSENGDYKLGDFGIAKTVEKTMGGTKIGTYKYMAPEVYNNQPYGTSADIYSLGLVLYWMLNNRRMPFVAADSQRMTVSIEEESRNRRLSGEKLPEPANGSKELKAIVMKACAYNPKDRYSSAKEMLNDLNALKGVRTNNFKVVLPVEVDTISIIDEDDVATEVVTIKHDFDATTELFEPETNDFNGFNVKEDTDKKGNGRSFPLWAKIVMPIMVVIAIVLGILLGTVAVGSNDDLIEVPDVIEKDYYDAIEILEREDLIVDIDNCIAVADANCVNNCVISQNPSAGDKVQKKTKIILTYIQNELELQTDDNGDVSLPDFSLRDKDEVINFLIEIGYEYEIEEINDAAVGKGKICNQEFDGQKVVIYVSIGPEAEKMHNVTGEMYEQVKEELADLGLIVNLDYVEDNSVEEGIIISQSIEDGCDIYPGDQIVLTIATNKPLVKIPDVKGKSYSDAKSELKSYGFSVDEERVYSRDVAKGQVIKTYPEVGNSVEEKSTITVYVSDGKQPVTVTYDFMDSETLQYVGDTYKNLPEPQRAGYTFSGWYYNGQPVTSKTVVEVATDHTLTAKWTEGKYTVTFNTNGAGSVNPIAVNYDEAYGDDLPAKLTKTGYIFKGWKDSSGNTITKESKVKIAGNHTLTAAWEPIKYYVKYNANGGTSATMSNTTHTYDEEKQLKLNTYQREGYEFIGWAISSDGIKKYNDGQSVKNLTSTNGYTYNLYAKWSAKKYTITYNANGGSGAPESQTKVHGSTLTLRAARPTRTGYIFLGWSESRTATSATYQPSEKFTENGNKTLYAIWQSETSKRITMTSNKNTCSVGDTIILSFKLSKETELGTLTFDVKYDSNVFEFFSSSGTDLCVVNGNYSSNRVRVSTATYYTFSTSEAIVTITFRARKTGTGNFDIDIIEANDNDWNKVNIGANSVTVSVQSTKAMVKNDVNSYDYIDNEIMILWCSRKEHADDKYGVKQC